jgi:ABC-type glycerol-3-phosphate transport system substrate-binding protein
MQLTKSKKIGLAVLLVVGLTLSACAGNAAGGSDSFRGETNGSYAGDGGNVSLGTEGNTNAEGAVSVTGPVGRYVEQAVTLPITQDARFYSMAKEGDSILICEQNGHDLLSTDGGKTYTPADNVPESFRNAVEGGAYVVDAAVSPSGERLCALYSLNEAGDRGSSALWLYLPEGEPLFLSDVPISFGALTYAPDGYFYAADGISDSNRIYRIDPGTGESEVLLQTEGTAHELCVDGKRLYAIVDQKVAVYDLATKTLEENDSLLNQNLGEGFRNDFSDDGSASALMLPDPKQEGLYFVNRSGLYYHVLHGSVMEQLIDGTLCSIGDSSVGVKNFIAIESVWSEDIPVFTIIYNDGSVMRYTYSKDAQSVPTTVLRIYSLYEDENINLAVSGFRSKHPELQVLYEIGIDGTNGVTPEDARSLLTMELAAGEGPGVIVMDGIPFSPYADKGVFADLSRVLDRLSDEELFDNAVEAYRQDGVLQAIPAAFTVPLLVTKEAPLRNMTDLASLADYAEASRIAAPDGSICNIYNTVSALGLLSVSSKGTWMQEGNRLDTNAIREFLLQAKRIYEAQAAGTALNETPDEDPGMSLYELTRYVQGLSYFNVLLDMQNDHTWAAGLYGTDASSLSFLQSCLRLLGASYVLMPGQDYGSGTSQTILTVNQASPDQENALAFIEYMISTEFQMDSRLVGIGINQDAFHLKQVLPDQVESFDTPYQTVSLSSSSESGEMLSAELPLYWPTASDYQYLEDIILQLRFEPTCDPRVYETVIDVGSKVLRGDLTIENGVKEIEKRTSLLLSE